jgi:hypothetical protein
MNHSADRLTKNWHALPDWFFDKSCGLTSSERIVLGILLHFRTYDRSKPGKDKWSATASASTTEIVDHAFLHRDTVLATIKALIGKGVVLKVGGDTGHAPTIYRFDLEGYWERRQIDLAVSQTDLSGMKVGPSAASLAVPQTDLSLGLAVSQTDHYTHARHEIEYRGAGGIG